MLLDGRTLVYAAVGDSCGLLAVPAAGAAAKVEELIAEHLPTKVDEYAARLCHHPELLVVYSSAHMFEPPAMPNLPPRVALLGLQ